ncbi:MAG: CdaR family transcriptional regulator [Eubacteriales bacterium]|jgi:carbohydrate diacid regulator
MLVSKSNAQRIVEEMHEIIQKDINLMDGQGNIIASTDPRRVGQFHEGAKRVIEGHLEELIVTPQDAYAGAKEGINLPIKFKGEIIGVIGITGRREEVEQHGKIIKKMTEILVLDSYLKEQGQLESRTRSYFIEEWIFGNSHEDDRSFELRGRLLGLDILKPRIAAVMYLSARNEELPEIEMQRIREKIFKDARQEIEYDRDNIVISIGPKCIFLMSSKSTSFVREKLAHIKQKLEAAYPVKAACGVGTLCGNYNEVNQSYNEAEKALKVSLSAPDWSIKLYEEINVELFIEEIPHRIKKEFVSKIFQGCSDREIQEWIEILDVFFKHNGSINKAADELFIHKNTLQYRINKLIRRTGFDPRTTRDGLLLYLALLIVRGEEL